MKRFDCLALDCPLFGPHFLEASAGTGKTFAIEHVFARHILEGVDVEKILVITFTRAATRELKMRIRANLQSLDAPYLALYGEDAKLRIENALAGFDRCQIFTIHGFCYRMLKEFSFEAGVGSLTDPDKFSNMQKLKNSAQDFLQSVLDDRLLCKEQLFSFFKHKKLHSFEKIVDQLAKLGDFSPALSYEQMQDKCKAALHPNEELLLEDFRLLQPLYKKKGENLEEQVRALAHLPQSLGVLIKEKGSLFKFLEENNQKLKFQMPSLNSPGYFERAKEILMPLIQQDPFPVLQAAFLPIAEKVFEESDELSQDEILRKMSSLMQKSDFVEAVRKKYDVAMIDEFQDTDALQWGIFRQLFMKNSIRSLYLVGDPKQSIYRFRKADVYTYQKAKDELGLERLYFLDTNYRSSKALVGALNALFSRPWLSLPKLQQTLVYHPVQAGSSIESSFSDELGALHVMIAEGSRSFEERFLPFAAKEIQKLRCEHCAILVKDRYQAEKALRFLTAHGIRAVAKSMIPLGQTPSFKACEELFEAVRFPRNSDLAKPVMAGPFASDTLDFINLKQILEERGLVFFARTVLPKHPSSELLQIFEYLFSWEQEEGFSFEGLRRFFKQFRKLDEEARQRVEVDEKAVQIMTMHASKGLEFDVVFALGLSARTPSEEDSEEANAEKLRQLYVAMTRAKKRLYVPLEISTKKADSKALSPIELFSDCFEGSFIEELRRLGNEESITLEYLEDPIRPEKGIVEKPLPPEAILPKPFTPWYLSSFTTLAKPKSNEAVFSEEVVQEDEPEEISLQSMPKGAETGVVLHKVFETIFAAKEPIWKSPEKLDPVVEDVLKFTKLSLWTLPIQQMVRRVLTQKMGDIALCEVDLCRTEMEFLYIDQGQAIKGFIDLVFIHEGKLFFLDWKSNWLPQYDEQSLRAAISANDYELQAKIYEKALTLYEKKIPFGGALYVFLRGETAVFL